MSQGDVITLSLQADLGASNPNVSYAGIVFDEIASASTPVPFELSPTLGLLMVGGIYGVNYLRKSRGKIQ